MIWNALDQLRRRISASLMWKVSTPDLSMPRRAATRISTRTYTWYRGSPAKGSLCRAMPSGSIWARSHKRAAEAIE